MYGKIKQIIKNEDGPYYLRRNNKYEYDAQGNRISVASYIDEHWYYTWYVRDAQGNILSSYSAKSDDPNNHQWANVIQDERFIYGSSRLGSYTDSDADWTDNSDNGPQDWTGKWELWNNRQKKLYELTNHLGNVTSTVTDFRIAVPLAGNPNITGQYKADIKSAIEYYPFGMVSRGTQDGGYYYKFGFNGKDNDDEIKGGFGKQQDYGMRIYDPRVARFFSEDPLTKSYPWYSPYQFAGGKPIIAVDLDGEEEKIIINQTKNGKEEVPMTVLTAQDSEFKTVIQNLPKDFKSMKPGIGTLALTNVVTTGLMKIGDPNFIMMDYKEGNDLSPAISVKQYTNSMARWIMTSKYSPQNITLESLGVKSVGAGVEISGSKKAGATVQFPNGMSSAPGTEAKLTITNQVLSNGGYNDKFNYNGAISAEATYQSVGVSLKNVQSALAIKSKKEA